jgi:alginate O-acetyltransferase complex protein AlgI
MLFNSIDFAIFLPLVFLLYWSIAKQSLRLQNSFIILTSYLFYAWWDYRFLSLLFFSTLVDYLVGIAMANTAQYSKRKYLLWLSILTNLGLLGFFKYYNFFLENFSKAFVFFGNEIKTDVLNIILPVGISFYTFQTLSYTIDIFRRKMEPTKDFFAFAAFVSFFPQLVAGPIERATNLLPQFYKQRNFDYVKAIDGIRQILWGLFKKIVIADNCAEYANTIFNNSAQHSGSTLVLGAIFFTFQIYGDFSGYSDIAIGTSRLFGIDLMRNFAFPYFSRDIAEFWRRWHISLSTWFRDYLYIPLGGSKGSVSVKVRNTFLIFMISGFWHGANWTFIAWGLLNALYFLPLLLTSRNRNNLHIVAEGENLPSLKDILRMLTTFSLVVFSWIFFRAENIQHAFQYINGIFSTSFFTVPHFNGLRKASVTVILVLIFISIEWIGRTGQYALAHFGEQWKRPYRYAFYYLIVVALFWFGGKEQQFIYFQF